MDTPVAEQDATVSPATQSTPENDETNAGATAEAEARAEPQDAAQDQFDTAIAETVNTVGGVLLFQMTLDEGETSHRVAAISIGSGEEREIVIVDLPADGGEVSVQPATESELPIASIAAAYAGLAECWPIAA
jgi:hypothetical protein